MLTLQITLRILLLTLRIFLQQRKQNFFDVIIPIIPIVNNTNSFDYLKSKLLDELEITDKNDFETFLISSFHIY